MLQDVLGENACETRQEDIQSTRMPEKSIDIQTIASSRNFASKQEVDDIHDMKTKHPEMFPSAEGGVPGFRLVEKRSRECKEDQMNVQDTREAGNNEDDSEKRQKIREESSTRDDKDAERSHTEDSMPLSCTLPFEIRTRPEEEKIEAHTRQDKNIIWIATPGEMPYHVVVAEGTTWGQVTIAEDASSSMTQPIAPMNVVGDVEDRTRLLEEGDVVLLEDAATLTHRHCPCKGDISEGSTVRCIKQEIIDFETWANQQNKASRKEVLRYQKGWVASDEIKQYLRVCAMHCQVSVGPLIIMENQADATQDWLQWLMHMLEVSKDESGTYITALWCQWHWMPVRLEVTQKQITVITSPDAGAVLQTATREAFGRDSAIQFRFQEVPHAFNADCGFQTVQWHWCIGRGQEVVPIESQEATTWRLAFQDIIGTQIYEEPQGKLRIGGTPQVPAGEHQNEIAVKVAQMLQQHGVPAERSAERAQIVMRSLDHNKIRQMLKSNRPWQDLKQIANNAVPKVQLVMGDELQAQIAARQKSGKSIGGKDKKQHLQRAQAPTLADRAQDMQIPIGVFAQTDGKPLQQLQIRDIGPTAAGVILINAADAEAVMAFQRPMTDQGLALIFLGHLPDQAAAQAKHIQFPVTYMPTGEAILCAGSIVQAGKQEVVRAVPAKCPEVEVVPTKTFRVAVYMDQCTFEGERFLASPVKELLKAHRALGEAANQDRLLDVWDRQWLNASWQPTQPKAASAFVVSVRIAKPEIAELLSLSGEHGVYLEPRHDSGRHQDETYQVIWLPKASVQTARISLNQVPGPASLARHGDRYGIRVPTAQAMKTHEQLRSDVPYVGAGSKELWTVGPLPPGTTKSAFQKIIEQWGWQARALRPQGRSADLKGIMWSVQALSPASSHRSRSQAPWTCLPTGPA